MRDSCIIGVGQEYWISQTLGLKVCPHPYFLQFHYKECLEQEEIIFFSSRCQVISRKMYSWLHPITYWPPT